MPVPLLFRQAIQFIGLSGIGWMLDFSIFTLFCWVSPHVVLNNIISSWVGVTFVFLFATRKLFNNSNRIALKWKYIIYLVYQIMLILGVSVLLGMVNEWIHCHVTMELITRYSSIFSKIIVTPITMILNFFVMKGVVEKL